MPNRREFLAHIAATGSAWTVGTGLVAAASRAISASKPLRVLILGGTGNIGPYHVRAAVAAGHQVAVFSRGKRNAEIPASVERLVGDRSGDLRSIQNRDWDAVIDIATYGPGWVRVLGEALRNRIKHYTFISTISVYEKPELRRPTTEDSPLLTYQGSADPYSITDHLGADYGALKALAEREAEKQFPGRTLVLRPGYIGGPGDSNKALTYWAVRAAKGGEILASDDPATPVQFIDVRDLAEWSIRMAETNTRGIFNAVGPSAPANLKAIIDAARALGSPPPQVTWVPSSWLRAREDKKLWDTLFFWSQSVGTIMQMSNQRALANGLTTRPVSVTLADSLAWYKQLPTTEQAGLVTGHQKKADGSGWAPVITPWAAYLEREREVLAAWRRSQSASARFTAAY